MRKSPSSPTETLDFLGGISIEHKGGKKAQGVVAAAATENAVIMPYLVDWTTTQATAGVNYKRKRLFLTVAYYGSYFNERRYVHDVAGHFRHDQIRNLG